MENPPALPPEDEHFPADEYEETPEDRPSISASLFSGPIPPPALMKEYAEIDPGFPIRFIEIFERQQTHDHAVERAVIENNREIILNNQNLERRGQLFGFILALLGLFAGITAAFLGLQLAGGIIGAGGLALLAGVFVYSRKNQSSSQLLAPVPQSLQPPQNSTSE